MQFYTKTELWGSTRFTQLVYQDSFWIKDEKFNYTSNNYPRLEKRAQSTTSPCLLSYQSHPEMGEGQVGQASTRWAEQLPGMNLNWSGMDVLLLPNYDSSFLRKSIYWSWNKDECLSFIVGFFFFFFFFKHLSSVLSHNATWYILFHTLCSPVNCNPGFTVISLIFLTLRLYRIAPGGLGIYFGYGYLYPSMRRRHSFVFSLLFVFDALK